MIKVLIIDDEPIIREGLRRTIDWDRLQCSIAGEAENGVEAVEKINSLQPDIVITDIMMPGLSGLELTKFIKDYHPHIKIIFLTGYNNFSFAQQAIKLGAFDFVLKPTNTDELEAIISKAGNEIAKSDADLQRQMVIKKMMDESLPILRDKFITDLIFNNVYSVDEIKGKMKFFGIEIKSYILMCAEIDNYNEAKNTLSEEDKIINLLSVKEKSVELLERCKIQNIIVCNQNAVTAILTFGNDEEEELLKSSVISIAEELRNKVENAFPFTVSIGISHFYTNIADIRFAYREAVMCLENRFYIGNNSTIHTDDIFNFESLSKSRSIEISRLQEAIRTGNVEKIKLETDTIINSLHGFSKQSLVRNLCMEIVLAATRLYCEIYGNIKDILEEDDIPFDRLMSRCTASELYDTVREIIDSICRNISEKQNSQTRKVVSRALEYIHTNFNRDISLNDVADHAFMSPWYFSKLFKKETGFTFTEFLLKVRIDQAKELLKGSLELKTYEIADKVGFNDARYFGQIFKKVTGLTPSEYKER